MRAYDISTAKNAHGFTPSHERLQQSYNTSFVQAISFALEEQVDQVARLQDELLPQLHNKAIAVQFGYAGVGNILGWKHSWLGIGAANSSVHSVTGEQLFGTIDDIDAGRGLVRVLPAKGFTLKGFFAFDVALYGDTKNRDKIAPDVTYHIGERPKRDFDMATPLGRKLAFPDALPKLSTVAITPLFSPGNL